MSKKYAQRIILNIIEVVKRTDRPTEDAASTIAENDAGENLHEKFDGKEGVAFERNELIQLRIPAPTTLELAEANKPLILAEVNKIAAVGADSILYVIGHSDPESKRLAGLKASDWADILGNRATFKSVKRIHFVGCHTAGQGTSQKVATSSAGTLSYAVTGYFSFAAVVHEQLKSFGIRTEVAAYCSFVRISPFGEIRAGFDENGERTRHAPATKVVFRWDNDHDTTRSMSFAHT